MSEDGRVSRIAVEAAQVEQLKAEGELLRHTLRRARKWLEWQVNSGGGVIEDIDAILLTGKRKLSIRERREEDERRMDKLEERVAAVEEILPAGCLAGTCECP